MTVTTKEKAWAEANKIFPTDYEKDETASANAGYDIYRHHTLNHYNRICDLGNRLEVLTGEYGENVVNIWIEPETTEEEAKAAEPIEYGRKLHDELRMNTTDFSSLTEYEKFILNRGWEFKTEEELRAGYAAFNRNRKKDEETEGKATGTILTELGYIKGGIDDVKSEQREQRKTNTEFVERLVAVEASAKQAHKRIDAIEH